MSYKHACNALRELEKIRTEKLVCRGLTEEANAVSAARVELDKIVCGWRQSVWHDSWHAPKGQDGYSQI